MALDSTSGGANSDSYVATTGEADTIAALLVAFVQLGVVATGYLAAATATKEEALKMGADRVDRALFYGRKVDSNQARAFPRLGMGVARYNSTIPDAVKRAQVAEACALMTAQSSSAAHVADGVKSFTVAEESVSFDSSAKVDASRPYSAATESILMQAGLIQPACGSVYMPRA